MQQLQQNPERRKPTYHVVDIFEDGSEATDDEGELVLGDVDQTFFVVLCADFGVGVLVTNFNGKLKGKTREDDEALNPVQPLHYFTIQSQFIITLNNNV